MMKSVKKSGVIFLIVLLFINLVYSAETVVVQNPAPAQEGFFAKYFGFFKSPIFWGIMFFLLLFLIVAIAMIFLVKWLVGFLKKRNDIFYRLSKDRIKLAKVHRSYPSTHWLKTEKNTPIRLVRIDPEGKPNISRPIAYHRGNYVTHEGNMILSLNMIGNKKWWFYPVTELLVIPNKEKIELTKRNDKGKIEKVVIDNLPQASEIVRFGENDILIYADSFSHIGSSFYVPVIRAKDNKIIDLSLPVFNSLKDVVMGEYLLEQTSDFVAVAKKSINLNPHITSAVKLGDNNASTEVPSNTSQ